MILIKLKKILIKLGLKVIMKFQINPKKFMNLSKKYARNEQIYTYIYFFNFLISLYFYTSTNFYKIYILILNLILFKSFFI